MNKAGRSKLGGKALTRLNFSCVVPSCSGSCRSDALKRHYLSMVSFDEQGNPMKTDSIGFSKLNKIKKDHTRFFGENGFTKDKLPTIKKPTQPIPVIFHKNTAAMSEEVKEDEDGEISEPESKKVKRDNDDETVADLSDLDTESTASGVVCHFPALAIPSTSRISISIDDYFTLKKATFINDTIVDFFLKYLYLQILPNESRKLVHIFSSMFFKKLIRDPVEGSTMDRLENSANLSMVEKRHLRVKKWTKNSQLFDMNLVLIPICENSHWYMVVLITPGGQQPRMLVLDSLGKERNMTVDIIMDYLQMEKEEHKGNGRFADNFERMAVETPTLTMQDNGFDCGLYLLKYSEKLLQTLQ